MERTNHTIKRGENQIKEEDILLIQTLYKDGFTQIELADFFKISPSEVHAITNNRAWRHLQKT